MTKSKGSEQGGGDIEIISIGTLYAGDRWEKRYWSSSRGRDRHPYPVGYQAARTHEGLRATMQILPGNTGPLFQITSSDGQTASGPTPHIAWKMFQRTPLVRPIRGKRLSPTIDGAEFFGFKHYTVQQLLRQLVTEASLGTRVPNTAQNKQLPNQSFISTACSKDKSCQKRQMDCMELTSDSQQKRVRPIKKRSLLRSFADSDICKNLNRSSSNASRGFAKPHPSIERRKRNDVCMPDGVSLDPPIISPNVNLINSPKSGNAPTAERSPVLLSRDGDILFSDPTNLSQKNDSDSGGEEITMSMMKLLLPQAVPLLRKARRTKNKAAVSNADYVDGKKNDSIDQDHNKTKPALESSKDVFPASFDTKFNEHMDLEEIPDVLDSFDKLDNNALVRDSCHELGIDAYVPVSCDEFDDNAYAPDSCDELDDNAYAPDSCDELDDNACVPDYDGYVPDSCDELDDNIYDADLCAELDNNSHVPDSGDELDENAEVPDSCDEVDDKEIIQDSPKQLNKNHYISDSSDPTDENYTVPDSCEESDEAENVLSSTRLVTRVDAQKVMQDSDVQACEGKVVTCTLDGGKILPTKFMDSNEANKDTMNLQILSEGGGCGAIFCEYEGNSEYKPKYQGQFNPASKQWAQNTNQNSHMGTTSVSTDILHGGSCPVISNGCQQALDKCVFEANLNAGSNKECAPNPSMYETVVKQYDGGCSENNYGRCRDAIVVPNDMPHSTSVLHDKPLTCGSYDYAHFDEIQKPPASDMVTNWQCMPFDANVSTMSETLHSDHSVLVGNNRASFGQICYPEFNVTKEPENKPSVSSKLIGFPSHDKELLTRGENLASTSQRLHHKQPASGDDSSTSTGVRTFDGHYSKLSTVAENENWSSCLEKLDEFPFSDFTDEELLMCDEIERSVIETLRHKQLTSVHDSKKRTGCNAFDGNKSMQITATEPDNKLRGFGKLIGQYAHPKPVLSMLTCLKGSEIYICTSCGALQDNQRTLFMYKIKVEGTSTGCPYFVGHSPMLLPAPKCVFSRQIAFDKSGIQFTPNGPNLVLLNGMQLPSCRNGSMQCQCLECETHTYEENAVKIAQLKDGYITVLAKLKTVYRVLCLLVCEPNYLVAVEANGAFRFWTMNSTWRYVTKEFILPPTDCISPCATELKQIPNCPCLVVGHNCLGEFGLWDVSRHTLLSRFFIPDTAVSGFVPLNLYRRNKKDNTFICLNTTEQPNKFKKTLPQWSSRHTTNTKLNLFPKEDLVISVLVATCPDIKSSYRRMPDGCWKLGLLINNKVVLNHTLDARAVTVAASGDCGVLGMNQGYLYVWDLSTGRKLGASLCFKDERIQCLSTDKTRSGLLAVADEKGKLLLYFSDQESTTHQTTYL